MEHLQYPIGKFVKPQTIDPQMIASAIETIAVFPAKLRAATTQLSDEQLDTPYRPGGWTIRLVVHHCADSHMNSFIRFKLALTEDNPVIKPYHEDRWAELADSKGMEIHYSLQLLDSLHARWVMLLQSLDDAAWKRTFVHPEHGRTSTLEETVLLYAWHCEHHLAHITR